MGYLDTNYGEIFYKSYGSGEAIVFLNGISMSTSSWSPFINRISKNYRMIVIDLIDQGASKGFEDFYTLEIQADVLKLVLDKLNIEKAHLVGMSYGGKVALTFALKYMNIVNSLSLVNTDAYTSKFNQELGKAWVLAAATLNGELFSSVLLPSMYSVNYYENNMDKMKEKEKYFIEILNQTWFERFNRTIISSKSYNVIDNIHKIVAPTLIVTSDEDITIPKKLQYQVHKKIKNSKMVIIKESGHAIMYEKPKEFIEEIMSFISSIIYKK